MLVLRSVSTIISGFATASSISGGVVSTLRLKDVYVGSQWPSSHFAFNTYSFSSPGGILLKPDKIWVVNPVFGKST